MSRLTPFHLAFPVKDLEITKKFYTQVLSCTVGREEKNTWIDFNLFGHQLTTHVAPPSYWSQKSLVSHVDKHHVPIPHFGVVLEWNQFHKLAESIQGKVKFEMEPTIRFRGLPGEQATMFFRDPSGNALEFKSFKEFQQIFMT